MFSRVLAGIFSTVSVRLVFFVVLFMTLPVTAMDIVLKNGKVFRNAEVTSVTHEHICIMHDDGAANIAPEDLSKESCEMLRKAFRTYLRKRAAHIIRQTKNMSDREKVLFLMQQSKLPENAEIMIRLRRHIVDVQQRSNANISRAIERAATAPREEAIKILTEAVKNNQAAENLVQAESKLDELQLKHDKVALRQALEKCESVLASEDDVTGAIIILSDVLKKCDDSDADEAVIKVRKRLQELITLRDSRLLRDAMREAEEIQRSNIDRAIALLDKAIRSNPAADNKETAGNFLAHLRQTRIDNLFRVQKIKAEKLAATRADRALPIIIAALNRYPTTTLRNTALQLIENWKRLQIKQKLTYLRFAIERSTNQNAHHARDILRTSLQENNHDFTDPEQQNMPGASELRAIILRVVALIGELTEQVQRIETENVNQAIQRAARADTYRRQIVLLSSALEQNPEADSGVRNHASSLLSQIRTEYERWRRANARTCWRCDGRGSYETRTGFYVAGSFQPTYRTVTCEYCYGQGKIMPD